MSGGARPARAASARSRCSPTGPIASPAGEVPPAPPRPQGIERNVVITQWDWADPKAYLHDVGRRPTGAIRRVNANGLIYGALELSADYLPVLDPVRHTIEPGAADGARSEHAADHVPTMPQPSPYWGERGDLDEQEQRAQPDVRRAGPRLDHVGGAAARQSGVLQGGLESSVGEAVPGRARRPSPRRLRSEDEEAHAHQHVLRHAPSDVRRGREQHAVDERRRPGRRLAQHEDVRRDRRRGEVAGLDGARSSTRTATASATRTSSRTSRSIRRRTSGIGGGVLRGRAGAGRLGLGIVARLPGRGRPARIPGANPPETALAEVYEPPFNNPTERPCRASRRAAWTSIATASCWVGARERTPGQLRSAQVQGAAQRTDGDRSALPRGLDALSPSRCRSSRA